MYPGSLYTPAASSYLAVLPKPIEIAPHRVSAPGRRSRGMESHLVHTPPGNGPGPDASGKVGRPGMHPYPGMHNACRAAITGQCVDRNPCVAKEPSFMTISLQVDSIACYFRAFQLS